MNFGRLINFFALYKAYGKVEILAKKQKAYFLGINCGRLKSAKKPTQKLAAQFHLKQCSLQIRPPKKHHKLLKISAARNKYYKKKSVGKYALAGVLQYQRLCPVRAFAPSNSLRILLLTDTAPADYPRRESAHI